MLVDFKYRSDDPPVSESGEPHTPSGTIAGAKGDKEALKHFNFYTVVDLGQIIPRDERKADNVMDL